MAVVTDTDFVSILSYVVGLVLIVACSLVVSFLVHIQQQQWKLRHFPGPKRNSFIFGNWKELQMMQDHGASLPEQLLMWAKEHGPIYKYSLLNKFFVVALDPVVVKEILTKSVHLKSPIIYENLGTVCGVRLAKTGLVTQRNHNDWKIHRTILNPSFNRKYLMELMEPFNEKADRLVEYLLKKADGIQEVPMYNVFNNITIDIITKVAFGMELDTLEDPDSPFPKAVMTGLQGVSTQIQEPWRQISFTKEDRKWRQEVRDAATFIRQVGRDCINNRIDARSRGEEFPRDMLTNILEGSENLKGNKKFGMEEMLDEFVTFFAAGQETTSNLLSFTMELLGKHPEVLKRVQQELEDQIGSKPFITYQDTLKLEYMMLVLKESLRYYSPVPLLTRVAAYDIPTGSGLIIPRGSHVTLCPYAMGRMAQFFDNPEVFHPERFKAEAGSGHPIYAYFPFSMGQRSCIGQQFALIEARVILAKILRVFQFDLVPGQNWKTSFAVTMRPVDGCRNYVSLRE